MARAGYPNAATAASRVSQQASFDPDTLASP
jgi:hypothetical protein